MSALRIHGLGRSRILWLLGSVVSIGCSSQYDPEPQFWPNLGPVSFGAGPAGLDGEADTNALPDDEGASEGEGSPGVSSASGAPASANSSTSSESSPGGGNLPVSGSSAAPSTTGSSASSGNASAGGSPSTSGGLPGGGGAGGSGALPDTGSGSIESATCSLSVIVTTTAPGGRYQPRNVGAIWIADSADRFVKSLDVWGNRRLSHVTAWNAATRAAGVPGNKVDAVSSATLTSHRTHAVSWNCEDYNGQVVPDDTYRVYFEVTDSNNSGPNHFESFTKGPMAATVQSSATNFNGIVLTFTP